jgi:hypothetical protein
MPIPAFATASDLETYMGRPGIDHTRADLLLRMASAVIRSELNQLINRVEDDAIHLEPRGGQVILLPELPVWEVDSVTETRYGITTALIEGTHYRVELGHDGRIGILRRLPTNAVDIVASDTTLTFGIDSVHRVETYWPASDATGDSGVDVVYDHGFDDANGSGGVLHELPDILWTVALRVAARGFTNPVGMRQETISRYSYTAAGAAEDIGLYLTAGDLEDLAPFYPGQRTGARA